MDLIVISVIVIVGVVVVAIALVSDTRTSQATKETRSEGVVPRSIDRLEDRGQSVSPSEPWSQGRLAREQISTSANTPIADSESASEYLHEYIRASTIKEEKGMMGVGLAQEVATAFPREEIETHLNKRGLEGWKLINMEPHWWYERQQISLAMSVTRPLAIVGWYLTFSRISGS